MKVKCDYCKALIDEDLDVCPHCGGPLRGANRTASEQPQTIEELQEWYRAHRLPPEEVTRFFIGKNVHEAKAFGIYRDESGDFVVYKNKADGTRAVRYQGSDEEYAVNELYQRLRAEIADQKYRLAMEDDTPKASPSSGYTFRPLYSEEEGSNFSKMDEYESQNHHEEHRNNGGGGSGNEGKILLFLLIWLVSFGIALSSLGKSGHHGSSNYSNNNDSGYNWLTGEEDDDDSSRSNTWSGYNSSHSNSNSSWWDDDDDWGWDSDSSWDSGWDSWDSGSSDWDSDW